MELKVVSAYKVIKVTYECRCDDCDTCEDPHGQEPTTVCYTPDIVIAKEAFKLINDLYDSDDLCLETEECLIEVTDNEEVDLIMLTVEDVKSCIEDVLEDLKSL